jgi:hypothetical protein
MKQVFQGRIILGSSGKWYGKDLLILGTWLGSNISEDLRTVLGEQMATGS